MPARFGNFFVDDHLNSFCCVTLICTHKKGRSHLSQNECKKKKKFLARKVHNTRTTKNARKAQCGRYTDRIGEKATFTKYSTRNYIFLDSPDYSFICRLFLTSHEEVVTSVDFTFQKYLSKIL